MTPSQDAIALIGRVLLAFMFVYSGFGKVTGFEGTVASIAGKGLPLPQVGAVIAIAVELGAGLMLAVGWKTRFAAVAIAVFTLAASIFFHNFWTMADQAMRTNQIMFLKNISIVGGMLMVVAFGPGRYSLDRR